MQLHQPTQCSQSSNNKYLINQGAPFPSLLVSSDQIISPSRQQNNSYVFSFRPDRHTKKSNDASKKRPPTQRRHKRLSSHFSTNDIAISTTSTDLPLYSRGFTHHLRFVFGVLFHPVHLRCFLSFHRPWSPKSIT